MKNVYDKKDTWSLKNIFIRLIAYPACFMFLLMGLHTGYITIFDAETNAEFLGGTVISITLLTIVGVFFYYDIRNIFKKDLLDEKGIENILDDEF